MRRMEMVQAIHNLLEAYFIAIGPVSNLIQRGTDSRTRPGGTIDAMRAFFSVASRFGDTERELSRIFDLSLLENSEFWELVLGGEADAPTVGIYNNLRFATEHLPQFIAMLEQRSSTLGDTTFPGMGLLSVLVVEEGDGFSRPRRISELLEGVSDLYEACAVVNNASPDDLVVLSCDSGSDKSFDFMGAASIIESVKEVLLNLWDKVVFFREIQTSNRLELIAKALPIIDQIGNLEVEKKLSPEQAELLRRKVADGAGKFLRAGATIPEMAAVSSHDPRQLMAPEMKQLAAPAEDGESDDARNTRPSGLDVGSLTGEELALLEDTLAKSREESDDPAKEGELMDNNP